jgi:PKD repeat protein
LTIFSSSVQSQCLTDHYHKEAKQTNPSIQQIEETFYNNVEQVGQTKRATKFIIPVVFHVIHTNGPENITQAQIEDQIRVLNEDFSFKNTNRTSIRSQFTGVTADCEIEFRLARIDPQGNCTNGINRVYSPLHVDARDNVKSISGARWDNRKYLNIWTVSSIKDQSGSGGITLGYAYLPYAVAGGLGNMDGIVMRADYVGTIGTAVVSGAGRTLTHEVGHYLGLLHTFEDGCSGTGASAGDRCADTPPVAGTFTNASCPVNGNSCNTDAPDLIDQWENFMDYSTGTCQAMFTINQKSIMHSTLTNYTFRISLVSANNLIATGINYSNTAPVAFFSSSKKEVCVGEAVSFYDISCKALVTSRQWTLQGANITSTNKDTPVVTYSQPGKYKVTLMVSNGNGSNTLAVEEYITVKPRVAIDKPSVYQNFESPTWNVATGWSILDAGTYKFVRDTTVTAYKNSACLKAPISTTVPMGQRFQLVTPAIDLRSLSGKSPKISFMVATQRKSTTSTEELRIYYSRGCDNNWTQFLYRNANFISYTTATSTGFTPTSSNMWKQISFSLNAYENDSNVSFMIEITGNQGNPIYLDAINIGQFNTDVTEIEKSIELNVYPNPSENLLNIDYVNSSGTTEVWLENMEGKRIATILQETDQNGQIHLVWNRDLSISSGIYVLKIKSNNQIFNKKVIFAD